MTTTRREGLPRNFSQEQEKIFPQASRAEDASASASGSVAVVGAHRLGGVQL